MPLSIPSNVAYGIYYTDGQFLTADTMQTEANYFTNWITYQNRSLYNAGWLMGLEITAGTGNTLSVTPGTGIDSLGDFLILPDNGAVYTLATTSPNPSYLYLCHPSSAQARAGMAANVQNEAAVLQLGASETPPDNGIVLARVSLDARGGITAVTDCRVPVTSKIQAQPVTAQITADAAALTGAGGAAIPLATAKALSPSSVLSGTVRLPAAKLINPGDRVVTTVSYIDPSVPAFSAPPRVTITVQGALPYAVGVSNIDTSGFVLTVTTITSTSNPPDELIADWIAVGS